MTAGGTVLLAGLGGAAGAYAGSVVMEDWTHAYYDPVNAAAVGGAIGAALATFIGVSLSAADKKAGTLSGPPQLLGWP